MISILFLIDIFISSTNQGNNNIGNVDNAMNPNQNIMPNLQGNINNNGGMNHLHEENNLYKSYKEKWKFKLIKI